MKVLSVYGLIKTYDNGNESKRMASFNRQELVKHLSTLDNQDKYSIIEFKRRNAK
jgi:hypothetical protein